MSHDPSRQLDDEVAGCAASHQQLLSFLDDLLSAGEFDPTRPSLLPGWSVGHVVAHLARNADAFSAMLNAAAAGEERLMYPSPESREEGINTGALRDPEAMINDLRRSIWGLEQAWAQRSELMWNGFGLARMGRVPVREFPWRRWREVSIHHADLGLTFTPSDWSPSFVASELPRRLAEYESEGHTLPAAVGATPPWQQLAWLVNRAPIAGVESPQWG